MKKRSKKTGVDETLARHGGLSYLEIPTTDARLSAKFYEKVFGWTLSGEDADHPKFIDRTKHLLGRWVTGRPISRKAGLLPYFYVDRMDDAVKQVAARGGMIVKGPFPEANLWIAMIRDPAGNVIGIWQDRDR